MHVNLCICILAIWSLSVQYRVQGGRYHPRLAGECMKGTLGICTVKSRSHSFIPAGPVLNRCPVNKEQLGTGQNPPISRNPFIPRSSVTAALYTDFHSYSHRSIVFEKWLLERKSDHSRRKLLITRNLIKLLFKTVVYPWSSTIAFIFINIHATHIVSAPVSENAIRAAR